MTFVNQIYGNKLSKIKILITGQAYMSYVENENGQVTTEILESLSSKIGNFIAADIQLFATDADLVGEIKCRGLLWPVHFSYNYGIDGEWIMSPVGRKYWFDQY